jgi:hypothetical protein
MSTETATKCAHPACGCLTGNGNTYCSQFCKESANLTEIACQCGHTSCANAINPSR